MKLVRYKDWGGLQETCTVAQAVERTISDAREAGELESLRFQIEALTGIVGRLIELLMEPPNLTPEELAEVIGGEWKIER